MKSKLGSQPAFARASGPEPRMDAFIEAFDGLTKREYAAIEMMKGMLAGNQWPGQVRWAHEALAEQAIEAADSILAELEKEQ